MFPHVCIKGGLAKRSKQPVFCILTALTLLMGPLSKADVQTPPAAPPPPAGYCSTIYSELNTDLQAFNQVLTVPPTWTPVPGGPTIYAANLLPANGNSGPGISSPNYIANVMAQLYEEKAMGAQAILVQIGFPVLYAPFQGGTTQLQPYLNFYQSVAQAVHALGMKLIVENDILLANDVQSGWPNLTAYFSTLSWDTYVQARATMAATIAVTMQPDYLVLAEEPNTESAQAGQPNLTDAAYASQMVSAEIAAVRTSTFPNVILGAGFGAWPQSGVSSLSDFVAAYAAIPGLDYIDSHVYQANTVPSGNLIDIILTVVSQAASLGKPVALSEYWLWKMENSEWQVLSADDIRARNAFSFWAPLDVYFLQTMRNLASYSNMVYIAGDGPDYLFTYQDFGGTAANGGLATCTCTTTYCDGYDILNTESQLVNVANDVAQYTATGLAFYESMVPSDTIAPSVPTGLTGTAAYALTNLSWAASTDNVGVAGYNVYRCSPAALGGPCTGVQVGTTSVPSYTDQNLTANTPYNYQVQAFDLANNHSQVSQTLSLITFRTSADAPTTLTATAVSPKQITLSWTPPSNPTGLTQYFLYSGMSPDNLQQFATTPSSKTTFNNQPLTAGTTYYYAVVAREGGLNSPMSPLAIATTLPLPNPPSNVTATPVSSTSVTLTWQETQASGGLPIARYQIWQGTIPGSLTNTATVTKTSYTGRNLTPGTTYYFEVVAVDTSSDASIPSPQVSAATWPLPLAPTSLHATTPAATQIALTWQWSQGGGLPLGHYYVYCGASPASLVKVGTATNSSFTYRSASPATNYTCDVVAADTGNDQSPPSSQISATTPPMPNVPTNLQATAHSSTEIDLTWQWSQGGGLSLARYNVYCGTSSPPTTSVGMVTNTSFKYKTATAATQYWCDVVAVDAGNDSSAPSSVVTVTTP